MPLCGLGHIAVCLCVCVLLYTCVLYQHQAYSTGQQEKRNNREKLTMFCNSLADRAEFDRTKNVMHVPTVSILSTTLNAHGQPLDSKTILLS